MFDRSSDRGCRTARGLFAAEIRVDLIQLPHLSVGSPTLVTVPGVSQVGQGINFEAARRVEARCEFAGERFVVNKSVCAGRANGLLVEPLGVELAIFQACDLRTHQSRAVLEILRAVPRAD